MSVLAYFRSLAARFFHRSQTENEMEEELRAHIAHRADDLERFGLDRAEAERRARIEFGGQERFKEECREAIAGNFIDTLLQDVRFSFRMLRKSPGFTVVAVLTIALGIGATTAIFSVVDATLLHPLPYPHAEQLVSIEDDLPGIGAQDVGMSEPEWQDLQHSGIFEYTSPAWYDDNNLTGLSQPTRVRLTIVAPDYFAILGVKPQLGRGFDPKNHNPGFTEEVVISDELWRNNFGSDPHILERSIRMDTDLYRIIGVMPPGFQAPGRTARDRNIEVWAATSFYGPPLLEHPLRNRRNLPTAIARLKAGLTIGAAQSRIDALVASLQKQFPEDYPEQARWKIRLLPLKEIVVGNVRQSLILLLGAVGLVLVIGCANIASLMLARASTRGREMAIRQALGAGRKRLIQQLLTESLLLSLLGAGFGLTTLFWAKDFLVQLVPESFPRLNEISISWGVLLFAVAASLIAGVIFGLVPALRASRLDIIHALKIEGRGSTGSRDQARTRRVLVVTEFGLALVLMVGASLLLRSFWDLLNVEMGFNPQSVMTVKTRLPYPNDPKVDVYGTPAQQAPFFREILRRTRTLPGVEEMAVGDLGGIPLGHDRNNQTPPVTLIREDKPTQSDATPLVDEAIVTADYFHLLGLTLRRGRLFLDFDNENAPAVAVINETMARAYWPNEDPLGKHLKLTPRATEWTTIVGIVADTRGESLEEPRVPVIYSNLYQRGAHHLAIFLRGHLDSATIEDEVRKQVQAVDPTLPVFGAQALNEIVSVSLSQRRFAMEIVVLFALTALLLTGLGVYGVISYLVSERTHEIGIRLALGAAKKNILQMVLRQGLGLALAGSLVGLVGALVVSNLMRGLLYGVRPTDPWSFVIVAVLLVMIALVACYLPARRATKVDPMVALREA
jgi:putative ABC transport system permease protein